ncbi:aspartate aminotransferase family protein [Actinocorallia libanotica]|uniref:Aminotransferase class V-fold PLP-dependent enzyme n=1 Tax=Actinocorallia libanotica TaxID=46162 RepID=A0ABP4CJW8_9ACTN
MLPENGRSAADLLAELAALKEADLPVHGGKVTAYVYDTGRAEIRDAAARAYMEMLEVNCLDPTAFPSIVELEKQVVGAVASKLGGGPATPGIFTNGGTESIMLAVKSARDARPVARPRLVVPATAHPAFHKAAHYLGLDLVTVPVDTTTFRVDPAAMEAAVDEDAANTVLVVVSAPSYPQGVIDPVPEVAALAAARGIPCHVDACVGGWLLPWLRDAGEDVPPFDLSVPGVTSISCDLHKYGYAPKGASVVLYADEALRRHAYFASAAWPGYTVINSTVQSSKGAGPLGGAWATMQALGESGYRRLAADSAAAARKIIAGVADIPGLRVLGDPAASLVAIASDDPSLDVFVLSDKARDHGWLIQPQLSFPGIPANVHLTLTGVSLGGVDALLSVLAKAAAEARESGPPALPDGLVDALLDLDLDTVDDAGFAALLSSVGADPAGGPGGMAVVNSVLDALPPQTRESLLIRFLSSLYRAFD